MSELSHDSADDGFHEIQLSGKQLVFLFIVTTTVIVVVFLCGVKVSSVEVKQVDLPPDMQRAMAKQAEAEREKRAKIVHAAGELEASEKLAMAAEVIAKEPVTITLRYLQTLTEIASEKNSTIIFPLPIELMNVLTGRNKA